MKDKKTLYVSDLDGTLLNSNKKISKKSADIINNLVECGLNFTFATARSFSSAQRLTKNLNLKLPTILCNGIFTVDPKSQKVLEANYFSENKINILKKTLTKYDISPMVYSYKHEIEKIFYINNNVSNGLQNFINNRKKDKRFKIVSNTEELYSEKIFYITCIDLPEKLEKIYSELKDKYNCYFHKQIYSGDYWLEIIPSHISKASAIKKLQQTFGFSDIVSFGDSSNDLEMFELSDECYAVENALYELKKIATNIINSNNNDAVAKWLQENFKK